MIIIAGEITIPAEKRADAIEGSKPFQQATRDDEAGCQAYVFAADPCRDDVIQVYELWDDAETLAAHFLHENYFNMRNFLGASGITGAVTHKYRVDAVAPVYNSEHVATVDFD
ncbi:MAG: antibiotic biosynthesis monooxygenase [Actinomycetota bacterium]